ncbi:hypothetical protein E2542_SST13989 [Spatholobus suberectus]|nr:hypothetical protein E2542_SST13989 [Spatholobus suberectus]
MGPSCAKIEPTSSHGKCWVNELPGLLFQSFKMPSEEPVAMIYVGQLLQRSFAKPNSCLWLRVPGSATAKLVTRSLELGNSHEHGFTVMQYFLLENVLSNAQTLRSSTLLTSKLHSQQFVDMSNECKLTSHDRA